MTADTPQARRRERVAERLREALATLERDPDAELTPSALARLAGVSRNTIYAGHRPILDALVALRTARTPAEKPHAERAEDRASRAELASKMRSLATQNAGLLQRALVAEQRVADLEMRNGELNRLLWRLQGTTSLARVEASDGER